MTPEEELELAEAEAEAERSKQPATTAPLGQPLSSFDTPEQSFRRKVAARDEAQNETLLRLASGSGLVDEAAGAVGAAKALPSWVASKFTGKPAESPADVYTRTADATQRYVDDINDRGAQVEAFGVRLPVAKTIGAMAPAVAGAPGSMAARLAAAFAQGGMSGFSHSPARVARGETAQLAADTATNAGYGLAGGLVGEGISKAARAVGSGFASRFGDVVADQAGKDAASVADDIASTRGRLGAESQKASRQFENTQRALSGTPNIGASPVAPDIQRRALMQLTDPSTKRLQEKVLERSLAESPAQVAVVEALESELAEKVAAAPGEAIRRTSQYFSDPVWGAEIKPRLANTVLPRAGMAAAAYGGGRVFDWATGNENRTGTIAGTGGAVGAIMGAPGMRAMLGNVAKSNRVTGALMNAGANLGAGISKAAPAVMRSAAAVPVNQSKLTEDDEDAVSAYLRQ